jgi:N-acetylglucosaminyldiphosphoundecaprenol N-acetyl-beta-D-mannosaminyltransferase
MAARSFPRTDVLGSWIADLSATGLLEEAERLVESRGRGYVCFANVHTTVMALLTAEYRRAINGAWVAAPDGMPLVWAHRSYGAGAAQRVTGPRFMQDCLARFPNRRHYLIGSDEATLEAIAERWPEVNFVGSLAPPFRPIVEWDLENQARAIDATGAEYVWVGLGAPKQEYWMAAVRPMVTAPVLLGVGAAFARLAGLQPDPPPWVGRLGLEWAYRLGKEPRRLWRRYLLTNTLFASAFLARRVADAMRGKSRRA